MVFGWFRRLRRAIQRSVTRVTQFFRTYPDRISTIHHYERVLDGRVDNLGKKKGESAVLQNRVNNTVNDKDRYNRLTAGYKEDDPIKRADLKNKEGEVSNLKAQIRQENINIDNNYTAIRETKSDYLGAILTNKTTKERIDSIYSNTKDRNKDVYYGMNRTNNSLLKTITATRNNHTADVSKVMYKNEQSSYFSWLNFVLLIIYFILWFIFAFMLYKIKGNLNVFIKLAAATLLLLFPFISIIYYKIYIGK